MIRAAGQGTPVVEGRGRDQDVRPRVAALQLYPMTMHCQSAPGHEEQGMPASGADDAGSSPLAVCPAVLDEGEVSS